jgi:predicted RNase H-like nuclease (RuvC/YqgF family)
MNTKKVTIIFISVLVVSLGVISYLLFQQKQENEDMAQLFALEKEEIENEYTSFANQYDELQMITTNDSLTTLLDKEKTKVQRLLEELRATKSTNAAEIYRLRKQIKTMRKVLRSYVVQIDSLNKVNKKLRKENRTVRRKYNEVARKAEHLAQEKKDLNQKVELASQLDATNIWITPKNKRGKATKRIKKTVKFAIGFTVVKNITAETGERTIYVRIATPNQQILTKNPANTFAYEDTEIQYSIKKYIEYTGEEQKVTVYWDVEEFLNKGTYNVYIFADGNMIGSQSFTLK